MGWLIAGIVEVVKWLANEAASIALVVWQVVKIIGGALLDVAGVVGRTFVKVWGFFGRFYDNVLRPFVRWSWQQIVKLHAWLKTTMGPLLKFLNHVRDDIIRIYTHWLRPLFDTLDALRATFKLLADFHVPFAQNIEKAINALEYRLMQPIRFALTKINELIDWTNRVINEDGLFQRLTLIQSQWAYVGDMWSVLLKHSPAGVSAADNAKRRAQTVTPLDAETLGKQLLEYYTTGGGELAPAIKDVERIATALSAT